MSKNVLYNLICMYTVTPNTIMVCLSKHVYVKL